VTAAAVEDRAAAEPSARDKYLAEWLTASAAADKWLRHAIADELAEQIPELEHAQAAAAARLEQAYGALQAPQAALAGLDAEKTRIEGECLAWQAKLSPDAKTEDRVEARVRFAAWNEELDQITRKRDFAESELLPFADAHVKARAALDQATAALEGWKLNAHPDFALFGAGQKTAAYVGLRFGMSLTAALRDREHPEHGPAVQHWLHLCRISGLRTEDFATELPTNAEQAKRFWDSVFENASPAEAPSSGSQVIEAYHAEMTVRAANAALEASPAQADHRDIPAGAREVPARPSMNVPRLRDGFR
jgi:hypothetical protein